MTELIAIGMSGIQGHTVKTVDARHLHAFLEVGKQFSHWIQDRISKYGFVDGQDFVTCSRNGLKGRPSIEYHITLDMAKELAMVERTDKGKQARVYFLECERRAFNQLMPAKPAELSRMELIQLALAAEQEKLALEVKVEEQQAVITEQAPKVASHDALVEANNGKPMDVVAGMLGTGRTRLFAFLREMGVIKPYPSSAPYQQYIDRGLFRLQPRTWIDHKRRETVAYTKTLVTGKGVVAIEKLWSAALPPA